MAIKFGPAGLGGVEHAEAILKKYSELGFEACEIAFTHGVYIKKKEDALRIGAAAKKFGISLSIHAPYWINLNSAEPEKILKSKERILSCLEIGTVLGATKVVFHPGYYGKFGAVETYEKIKNEMLDLQAKRKELGFTPELAPETTGKVNVFGSIDEIAQLVTDTGCSFCVDFAHILARYKDYSFKEVFKAFRKQKKFHIHFSGIEYGEKGERKHKITLKEDWKDLLPNLPSTKSFVIINESPSPVEDSVLGKEIY